MIDLPTCPQCGSLHVVSTDTCQTWPSGPDNTGWMSCQGCYSAMHIFCTEDDCDWSYEWGLNPRNPIAERNEHDRPDWLDYPYNESIPDGWWWPMKSGVAAHLYSPYWDDCFDAIRDEIMARRAKEGSND